MATDPLTGLFPCCRRPCKSVVKRKQNSPDARYGGARKTEYFQNCQRATCASRRRFLRSQNRTSICCLRPGDLHRRSSLCSLPVPKQSEGSLGSLISVAQSANGRTWQPAHCVIPSAPASGGLCHRCAVSFWGPRGNLWVRLPPWTATVTPTRPKQPNQLSALGSTRNRCDPRLAGVPAPSVGWR